MAVAFECDMCGKLVKDAQHIRKIECGVEKIKNSPVTKSITVHYYLEPRSSSRYQVELCNDCQIKILQKAVKTITPT